MLAVPLLSMIFSPQEAVGIMGIAGFVNIAAILLRVYKLIRIRRVIRHVITAVFFAPLGIYFLKNLDRDFIMKILGIIIIIFSIFPYFQNKQFFKNFFHTRFSGFAGSALSGVIGAAYSMPGPPMILYYYNTASDVLQAKADIQFYFFLLDLIIIPLYFYNGIITPELAVKACVSIPAVILGSLLGCLAAGKLPVKHLKKIINFTITGLGIYIFFA